MDKNFVKTCSACGAKIGTIDSCEGRTMIAMKDGAQKGPVFHSDPANCQACGVATDRPHHLGCPLERCPACHGPLQRCGCMEGSDAVADQPGEIALVIKYTPGTNEVEVFGQLSNKVLCYGMLERARDVIQNWQPPQQGPGIIVP
ncbi:hypothetical protein LCGC14_2353430, partial [marine sediment metagenome]